MSELSYQPLTTRQFRLLTLLPGAETSPITTTLRHVDLDDKPTFDALSYEWGPESTHNSEIFVDKQPFTIRDNLWHFLKRLRASSETAQVIYADAICINQRDGDEKGRQVALMSEIYMRAKKVLVWLREHAENSELVFGTHPEDALSKIPKGIQMIPFVPLLSVAGSAASRIRRSSRASHADRVAAWTALLSRSYWNRTWIIQEMLLARSMVFFCGPDHMDGDLIFTKPLVDHFMKTMRKNKEKLDGVPRAFLLYFWKRNQKHHGLFGKGKPYFANVDIFELAFNFQYTECQVSLDHVYGLLALEDLRKSVPITPNYSISPQVLFIDICMSKLPRGTGRGNGVTDDGVWRVPKLFRGLRLTCAQAEEILDILLDNKQYRTQDSIVIATIAKAFDQFGLLKPERKHWILPKTKASQTAEQIISITTQWRMAQKQNGNWYDLPNSTHVHDPRGLEFFQLDEPLWSHYTTLRSTLARNAAGAANAQNMNQMNQMNMNQMNTMAMMGPGGGMGA